MFNKVELIRPVEACWACGKPTINRHPKTNHPLCPKCQSEDKWRNHVQVTQAQKDLARERRQRLIDSATVAFIVFALAYVVSDMGYIVGQLIRSWLNGWLPF